MSDTPDRPTYDYELGFHIVGRKNDAGTNVYQLINNNGTARPASTAEVVLWRALQRLEKIAYPQRTVEVPDDDSGRSGS